MRPILLVTTVAQRRLIAGACERSRAAGIRPGMTLAHARALLPAGSPLVEESDPQRDGAALEALAAWATRFSPLVAPDPPDGLSLDITGCERVFGGERRLIRTLARSVERLGFAARVAVAPTLGCARAVARFGVYRCAVVPPGRARDAMAGLPIRALRIDEAAAAALQEMGVDRIEHLLALPREQIPSRFGPELLSYLDAATREDDGLWGEIVEPVRPAEPIRTEVAFDGPTTRFEAVHAAAKTVLDGLCASLERLESGARLVELTLARASSPPVRLSVTLSRPSRSPRHLWSLLHPMVEKANLGFGVDGVSVRAERVARLPHEQGRVWRDDGGEAAGRANASGELIDALISRLGPDAVLIPESVETHIPERRVRWRRAGEEGVDAKQAPSHPGIEASSPAEPAARPTILFDSPEPARVMALVPDGPPGRADWRGRTHAITRAAGPERLGEEWWRRETPAHGPDDGLSSRDYFKAQTESGLWLWLYRDSDTTQWFVHGVWG